MKVAYIGYATNQGITVIAHSIADNIKSDEFLIVKHPLGWKNEKCWLKKNYWECDITHPTREYFEKYFESVKPDIFFMVETPFSIEGIEIAKRRNIKTIFYPMVERFPRAHPFWSKVANSVDLIACPTIQSYNYFRNYYPDKKVVYLQYPIDTKFLKFKQRKKCKVFLHNAGHGGILSVRKGTREVVKAFNEIKNNDNIKLIINSQKSINYYKEIAPLIKNNKNIDFRVINTSDLNSLYADGDVAVQPSQFEGVGLTIPESMACGLPTITTNAAPMNEFVKNDNYLVDVKNYSRSISPNKEIGVCNIDVSHLTSLMEQLINCDISSESIKVRQTIEEKFSWNIWRDKYIEEFNKII